MAVRTVLSTVTLALAPSRQPPGHCSGFEISSASSSLSIQLRFLTGHESIFQHYSREPINRKSPGRCWAMAASQLSLLSSAGIVDQNERLKDAAKAGDLQALNEILTVAEVSVDLRSSSRAGWTALHLACFYGHSSVVESLITAGANLEVRNDSGNTPLQLASLEGHIDIAQILLESGADFYAESSDRGTALDYAQEWGGEDIVDFLLLWAANASQKL